MWKIPLGVFLMENVYICEFPQIWLHIRKKCARHLRRETASENKQFKGSKNM